MSQTHLKLLSATVLILSLITSGNINAAADELTPPLQQSISQRIAFVSPAILAALQPPSFDDVTSEKEAQVITETHLQKLKALQNTATTDIEKDLLNLQIAACESSNAFNQQPAAELKAKTSTQLQTATSFFETYIQTSALKTTLIAMVTIRAEDRAWGRLREDRSAEGNSLTPQESEQLTALKSRGCALAKTLLSLAQQAASDPVLSAELDALDKIALLTKKHLKSLKRMLDAKDNSVDASSSD
jgi:hypothetical protein